MFERLRKPTLRRLVGREVPPSYERAVTISERFGLLSKMSSVGLPMATGGEDLYIRQLRQIFHSKHLCLP
jgi:hypothetical protein